MGLSGEKGSIGKEYEDPDFGEVVFEDLPTLIRWVRCHHKQRERLQRQMEKSGMSYLKLLKMCSKITGREIRDVGGLSREECNRMIVELGGRVREGDFDDETF